jgi:hypothetical protein
MKTMLQIIISMFVFSTIVSGGEIPLSSLMRGGTPPSVMENNDGLSAAEQRALIAHLAVVDSDTIAPAGVFGYYDETASFSDEDVIWYHFDVSPGNARFIHLEPTGDAPVRVTMGWEDESEEFHARAKTAGQVAFPLTVGEDGRLIRGNNTQLLAERLDIEPADNSGAIDIQVRKEYKKAYSPERSVERSEGFILISGAKLSPLMQAQIEFIEEMKAKESAQAIRVDAYLEKHDIPQLEVLEDGTVREIIDIEDGEPVYAQTVNLGAARTSHVEKVWPGGSMGLSADGSEIPALGEWDSGPALARHREFGGRVRQADNNTPQNHSTHVGGTLVASGVDGRAKGMCHAGRLSSYKWNNVVSRMSWEASNNGMLVSQHSYTMGSANQYDRLSADWDNMHLNNPYKLGSKSAANDGRDGFYTVRDAGHAKNNITIGAINEISGGWSNPGNVRIASFSSKGPSNQNRVKPDLVAKGVQLYSSTVDGGYGYMSGTSMAGPAAAGMLGLMQDHYARTHGGSYMRAATLKAVAINTAGDAGTEGPNATFGWGVVHVARAARLISNNADEGGGLIQELRLNNGSTMDLNFTGSGEGEIKATIVWPDAAGSSLNNDLDLRLTVDGQTYNPWYLTGTGAASRGDNSSDNIEKITTGINRAGAEIGLRISHKGSLSGGSQNFSLAIDGATGGDPKILNLLAPSEGDVLQPGSDYAIRWESEGEVGNIQIDWGHVGGQWSTVAESVSNDGSYTWSVPDTSHEECVVRITEAGGSLTDRSGYFEITQPPVIDVEDIEIDTSLRNNEEVYYDLDIGNTGRGVLQARLSQTSAPSDLIDAASWSAATDDFGSEVDTAGGIIQDGSAIMGYTIVEQPDDNSWPWATMTTYLGKEFTGLESIEVSYSSDHEVSLALDQTGLTESGTSHRAVLPATGGIKDTVLSVAGDFSQPEWVEETTPLDLSEVQSASFSISPEYTSVTQGDLRVESMSLEGVDLPITESPVSVDPDQLEVGGQSSETVRISLSAGEYETGEYHDTVVIRHNDPDADAVRIPVRLEIRENRNPEFDDIGTDYSLDPGDAFELEVSASDPDDDAVSLSTEDLPAWLSADDSESGVLRISGSTDDSHAGTDYSFRVVASDDFDPVGQAELEITIKVGTDIVEIDTISGGNQKGIFPAQNPGQLSAESFEFSVLTGKPATVRIVIYDNLGNILDEQEKAGSTATGHVLSWDMRNVAGQKVGAGSYLIVAEITYENGTGTSLRQMIGLRK